MSTRCQILVEGSSVVIYKHSDGYTEGVLPLLLPLLKEFTKYRGSDPVYMTAQIVAAFIKENHDDLKEIDKKGNSQFSAYNECKFLGYGVEAYEGILHGDIEYFYVIKKDHVEVRTPNKKFYEHDSTTKNTELLQAVDFDGKKYKGEPEPVKTGRVVSRTVRVR